MVDAVNLVPLHDGPHDSVGDLTAIDYVLVVVILLALVGIGAALWHVIQRRRE
jgi:hypothetical protein